MKPSLLGNFTGMRFIDVKQLRFREALVCLTTTAPA
jgi:hypothetical protein